MLRKTILLLGSVALAVLWLPVQAQTPDGSTPAEETFCDDNFTGRLQGLCNAFCEATDCDSLEAKASATACQRLESKIEPLLDEHNMFNGTDFEIRMADGMFAEEGNCGSPTGSVDCAFCAQQFLDSHAACGTDSACIANALSTYATCTESATGSPPPNACGLPPNPGGGI